MIVIPGTESAPFYYWSGNPFDGSLTAHNYERRILTVGLDRPVSIRNLPLIHNRSPESVDIPLADILLIIVSIAAGVILLKWRGYRRWAGIAVLILVILSLFNYEPFKITPYDAYHGDQGIAPYQNLIDNVNREGGMTFWNYPETRSGVHKMGPIRFSTLPYPGVITNSKNYTGFAALYGDEITITDPGGLWDLALTSIAGDSGKDLRGRLPRGISMKRQTIAGWGISRPFSRPGQDKGCDPVRPEKRQDVRLFGALSPGPKDGRVYRLRSRFTGEFDKKGDFRR